MMAFMVLGSSSLVRKRSEKTFQVQPSRLQIPLFVIRRVVLAELEQELQKLIIIGFGEDLK
jgi:hypothetical protein